MKTVLMSIVVVLVSLPAVAQENPLAKSSAGDWAKYLVTTKNETVPLMSSKDQERWWVISNVGDGFVRIDNYTMFGGSRRGAGGRLAYFKDRYEPVAVVAKTTKVEVVSTGKESLTIRGKRYECTKIVRKIDQPVDDSTVQPGWSGTSTIWISAALPVGLARMENVYHSKLSKSDKGQKIAETWQLAECGFKDWK